MHFSKNLQKQVKEGKNNKKERPFPLIILETTLRWAGALASTACVRALVFFLCYIGKVFNSSCRAAKFCQTLQ